MIVKFFRFVCPAPEQGQPEYLHAYRMWISFWLGFAFVAALIFPLSSAQAGVVSEVSEHFAGKVTDDPVAQKEIGNAAEALIKVLPNSGDVAREIAGGASTIRPARNISGPFEDLVVNFDKVACAAWIISYRDWLLGLMLKRDPETPPEVLAKAQDLLNKVIYGCRKILDPDSYKNAGTGTTGGGASPTQPPPDGPGAARVEVIDGELMVSVSDNICWNRCREKWMAWKGAESMRKRAEERIRDARRRADVLETDTIPWLERRLESARKDLADMQAKRPPWPRSDPPLNARIAQTEADIANLRTDIAARRAEVASLRQEARALEQRLPGLVRDEKAKLQAYLDCLHACAVQARGAGDPSSFAEKTEAALREKMEFLDALQQELDRRTSLVPTKPRGVGEMRMARGAFELETMQDGILVRIAPGLPTSLDNLALQPNRRAEDDPQAMPHDLPGGHGPEHGRHASHPVHTPSESQD